MKDVYPSQGMDNHSYLKVAQEEICTKQAYGKKGYWDSWAFKDLEVFPYINGHLFPPLL